MQLKSLDKVRFDALCYARLPIVDLIVEEIEWYADDNELVLGIVQYHRQDSDWCWTVLGRDANGQFRAIACNSSISSKDGARTQLHERMRHHAAEPEAAFFQGDEKRQNTKLFEPLVPSEKLHPLLKLIQTGHHHSAARGIMQEIANAFMDLDGNYVKDFQTTGFNARLWELFLSAFFHEQRFDMLHEFNRPDFCVIKSGFPIGIEAVTVNASAGEQVPPHSTVEERQALCEHYLPIRFGSPLYSKLQKRYWELPHMIGKPLMFAVHDFLCDDSMTLVLTRSQ